MWNKVGRSPTVLPGLASVERKITLSLDLVAEEEDLEARLDEDLYRVLFYISPI